MKSTLKTTKRIAETVKVDGIISFDVDNKYPQRVLDIIANSVTASGCVDLYSKHIRGRGFKDLNFFKLVINKKGMTNDKFLRRISDNKAALGDYAIHLNYNLLGEVVSMTPVPSWFCRMVDKEKNEEHRGMIAVYDNWDKKRGMVYNRAHIQYYFPFNPNKEVILRQIQQSGGFEKYKGQILWFAYEEGQYVLPIVDAVLEDCMTEGKAKNFKLRNISTQFMASHLLVVDKKESGGVYNNSEIGEASDGEEVAKREEETSDQMEQLASNLQTFQGDEEAGKIMIIEKDTTDQEFDLKRVEIQDVEDLFQFTEESSRDNIARRFLAPGILLGIQVAGKLGTSKEISDARKFYNSVTEPERNDLEELFTRLFSIWHDQSQVSQDKQIHPLETSDETNIDLVIKVVSDTSMSPIQKKGTLMKLFNYSEEDANIILAITPGASGEPATPDEP